MRGDLYLVRHGESIGNVWKDAYRDDNRNFLSPYGVLQAQIAGHYFQRMNVEFSLIVSSNLTRARHTTAVILHATGWHRSWMNLPGFNEVKPDRKEDTDRVIEAFKFVLDIWVEGNLLLVSHYHTMQVLFDALGVDRNKIDSYGGRHVGNAQVFVQRRNTPDRIHLLDLTKVGDQL